MDEKFDFNKDQKRRDALLGITGNEYHGGICHYKELPFKTLSILLKEKFADPQHAQNDCPEIQIIFEFMKNHPEFSAHGYAVDIGRDDYRVSIEGVSGKPKDEQAMIDFANLFRGADDFMMSSSGCYCWYD